MLRYLIALLLMPPCITIAQDHCTYINELERILKTDPELSAEKSIFAQPGNFLSVGNGYAPARPGFESTEEMVCAMKSHGFDMIWAGGDVLGCQNQRELGQKIEAYAKKFNQHVKAMLIEQGAYRQPHFGHPRQPQPRYSCRSRPYKLIQALD